MVKILLIGIAVVITGVLLSAATRPDTFHVQRSAAIQAPPERIYGLIEDFRHWSAWSPWEKKDPGMKRTFGDQTRSKGATYAWDGNGEVGQGRMEITDTLAPSRLALELDFVRPFEAHNRVDFAFAPSGSGTEVTWSMQGDVPYLAKIIHLFVDMDRMVGKDFEAGLANLKLAAEAPVAVATPSGEKR